MRSNVADEAAKIREFLEAQSPTNLVNLENWVGQLLINVIAIRAVVERRLPELVYLLQPNADRPPPAGLVLPDEFALLGTVQFSAGRLDPAELEEGESAYPYAVGLTPAAAGFGQGQIANPPGADMGWYGSSGRSVHAYLAVSTAYSGVVSCEMIKGGGSSSTQELPAQTTLQPEEWITFRLTVTGPPLPLYQVYVYVGG